MTEINKEFIEERVEDWRQRLNFIFSLVKNALKNEVGIQFHDDKTVVMNEELMQKYDVMAIELPILEVKRSNELLASFKPKGLWVIGANGRIDILTAKGSYILVDLAGKEEPSNWQVYTPQNRKKSISFNEQFIKDLF
jgi:hypothetical protein